MLRLHDIVENADNIGDYIHGLSFSQFRADRKTIDATERCLSRISETIVQIGEDQIDEARLGVNWAEMKNLGNRLRHDYRRIDKRIIYDIACDDVPALRAAAARLLDA